MGASFTAYAIIGVRVDRKMLGRILRPTKRVKAFEHNHPADWLVEPTSGRKLWKDEVQPCPDYDSRAETLFTYKILNDGSEGNKAYIAGIHTGEKTSDNCGPYDEKMPIIQMDINKLKDAMKEKLEPLGLWNGAEFGLWAVLSIYA